MPERNACQRCRIEARKWMERIALDFVSFDRRIQKTKIKRRVMANEYGSMTAGALEFPANNTQYISQCLTFANRSA